MAALQGLRRLNDGIKRTLTKSEVSRGYLFVTMDKEARKKLGEKFSVRIGHITLKDRKIDLSGRIFIGQQTSKKLEGKILIIKLSGINLVIRI